jgi:WD40 repeat protein
MKRRNLGCISAITIAAVYLVSVPFGTAQTRRFPQQLTIYDRSGRVLHTLREPGDYNPSAPVFSPDGTRLAFAGPRFNIWVLDLTTGHASQITSDAGVKWQVAWSPDSSHIAFVARRDGHDGIYRKATDGNGPEELLYRHPLGANIWSSIDWSPDGRFLCFDSGGVLYSISLDADRRAVELIREEYSASHGRFFANGRFVATRLMKQVERKSSWRRSTAIPGESGLIVESGRYPPQEGEVPSCRVIGASCITSPLTEHSWPSRSSRVRPSRLVRRRVYSGYRL